MKENERRFKCKECDSEEFEVTAYTHDTVTFASYVPIDKDGAYFDTQYTLKEYVGDTDYENEFMCLSCHTIYNLEEF